MGQKEDIEVFLDRDLSTPRLHAILRHLWLAGFPHAARPLHRQQLLQRTIYLTERADEHLVWHETSIFIKPIPEYLLDFDFWETQLCHNDGLYRSACGFLLSYAWLIRSRSDLRIAHDTGLLPADITFEGWTTFITDFADHVDVDSLQKIDPRYGYGELRLTRLNALYRFGAAGFSIHHVVRGYMSVTARYTTFFERKFGWVLAVLVYITVVLGALQVALGTERLKDDGRFQAFAYGVCLVSLSIVLGATLTMLAVWWLLFWFHILSTSQYHKEVAAKRSKGMKGTE